MKVRVEEIQNIIGYTFENAALLEAAFTHSSYSNEHGVESNERLEFLGDSVLGLLVAEKSYNENSCVRESELSANRARIVCEAALARLVDKYGFLHYMRVGNGEVISKWKDKARSNVFEAIVGAIYLDGGLQPCREFLDGHFYSDVVPEIDYISCLKERSDAGYISCEFSDPVKIQSFPDKFRTVITVCGREFIGEGERKSDSKRNAAMLAVTALGLCKNS